MPRLQEELAKLEQQLAVAKKQVEEETLQRVDLQNRVKTLKEDLHFKSQVYEQVGWSMTHFIFTHNVRI